MGQKNSQPQPVLQDPNCKVVIHGNDWETVLDLWIKLSKTDVPSNGLNSSGSQADKQFTSFAWFTGGRTNNRAFIKHRFAKADLLIYLIDKLTPDVLEHSQIELHSILRDEMLTGSSLIIVVHRSEDSEVFDQEQKLDQEQMLDQEKVLASLGLDENMQQYVQSLQVIECNVKTGEGMNEVMTSMITEFSRIRPGTTEEPIVDESPEVKPTVKNLSIIEYLKTSLHRPNSAVVPQSA